MNGSHEDGRAWCSEKALDEKGSRVTLQARLELVDADGEVCERLEASRLPTDRIDLYRHHRLLALDLAAALPERACGGRARAIVSVRNDGPAPLVVHRTNSSLLLAASG